MAFKKLQSAVSVLFLILLFHSSAVCQDSELIIPDRLNNRFNISLVTFSANKLQIDSKNDMYLNSRRTFSGEIGLTYDFYQSKNFFISVGFGIGVIPLNLYFHVPPDDLVNVESPHNDLNHYSYALFYSSFPVTFNYIIQGNRSQSWNLSAGAAYGRIYFDAYQIEGGMTVVDQQSMEEYEIFSFYLSDTISRHHLNFLGAISSSWETKRGRSWTVGLITQIGTRPVGTGSFKFLNVEAPGSGTVALNFNYVGIRTTYGFRTPAYKGKEAKRRNYKDG